MEIGIIGLGRMGGNMAERLLKNGHNIIGYSQNSEEIKNIENKGARIASSAKELLEKLSTPRIVWLMIPEGAPVDSTIEALTPHLLKGDIIIDGGNSYYKDSMRRAENLANEGVYFVDAGVSGGIWGLKEGYSMMIGGDSAAITTLTPIFQTLAPASDKGWGHVGPSGSGHFVKMIHNGIEYGMMQAYAEGYAIMEKKKELSLDLHQVSEIWRHGSVVRSWLLDLISQALQDSPDLSDVAPFVEDSGEGRWTASEAIDLDIAAPIITLSLMQRLHSRDNCHFAEKLLATMRNQFGGHDVKSQGK